MKTISIKKRLAAVTVLALAAGVMSSVAANAANAATVLTWTSTYLVDGSTGYANGAITVLDNNASGASSCVNLTAGSSGIIGSAFTRQVLSTNTPAAGVMLASGRLTLTIGAPTAAEDTLVVTGGQVICSTAGNVVNVDGTKVDVNQSGFVTIAPTVAAGGTISIQRFANVAAPFAGSATLDFTANVSVAASSVSGAASTAKSYVYLDKYSALTPVNTAYDQPTGFTVPNGSSAVINFAALDAYKQAASGSYLTYSSDNCYVGLNSAYSTLKSNFDSINTYGVIYATPAVANTATNCVVTIAYGSTVLGTKTIKFLGDIATVTASAGGIENQGGGNVAAGLLSVTYKDAAGNVVPGKVAAIDSGSNAYVTTLDTWTYDNTDVARAVAGKSAVGAWVCGGSTGSASIVLKVTNAAGATIKAAPVTLACGAAADSYTIATDKSSYAAGEIATVTVTFKDAAGGVSNDVTAFTPVNTVASGAFTGLVTATSTADTSTSGVLTYKAIVGQVAGSFPVVVSIPSVNAAHGKDQTAMITVTSQATDSVSQLVKVVGTLLTSFTKQIAALIKALSKKK